MKLYADNTAPLSRSHGGGEAVVLVTAPGDHRVLGRGPAGEAVRVVRDRHRGGIEDGVARVLE